MGNRIDRLFREWQALGGHVLLAEIGERPAGRTPEAVVAESTTHCRESGRLTWVVLDWLTRNADGLDERLLIKQTHEHGDSAVLGVLCEAAYQRNPSPVLDRLIRQCRPNRVREYFFHRVARSPLAARLTRENPLELFLRWNFLSNELRYLADEPEHGLAVVSRRGTTTSASEVKRR